jgi:aryl-alcohol dehydrogenase-like predicted oxidoreductase
MRHTLLGHSGLRVSEVALGTMRVRVGQVKRARQTKVVNQSFCAWTGYPR